MLMLRLIAVLGVALICSVMFGVAVAHEWYPHECCHDQDCAAVVSLARLADGRLRVETEHGIAYAPVGFDVRPSPDNKAHACLRDKGPPSEHRGWILVCLFLPAAA